jgi:hypothetical protein
MQIPPLPVMRLAEDIYNNSEVEYVCIAVITALRQMSELGPEDLPTEEQRDLGYAYTKWVTEHLWVPPLDPELEGMTVGTLDSWVTRQESFRFVAQSTDLESWNRHKRQMEHLRKEWFKELQREIKGEPRLANTCVYPMPARLA